VYNSKLNILKFSLKKLFFLQEGMPEQKKNNFRVVSISQQLITASDNEFKLHYTRDTLSLLICPLNTPPIMGILIITPGLLNMTSSVGNP